MSIVNKYFLGDATKLLFVAAHGILSASAGSGLALSNSIRGGGGKGRAGTTEKKIVKPARTAGHEHRMCAHDLFSYHHGI